ncbi:MAG: hypothetical protein R2880_09695 [Deinococcales bacterium]
MCRCHQRGFNHDGFPEIFFLSSQAGQSHFYQNPQGKLTDQTLIMGFDATLGRGLMWLRAISMVMFERSLYR